MNKYLFGCLLLGSLSAQAMSLNEYIEKVKIAHRGYQSFELSKQAADDRQTSGDVVLEPMLTFKGAYQDDLKLPNMLGATESKATQYSLGFSKKFSTGTGLNLTAQTTGNTNTGFATGSTLSSVYGQYAQGALGVSISQSLWKDSFGHATRLRWERESSTAQAEKGSYDLQERQLLIDAENTFWEYLYLEEDMRLRKASIERAKKIESWVARRVNDGIGDRADLLNAQALVASREMQLVNSEDEYRAVKKKVRDFLEMSDEQAFPQFQGDIHLNRNLKIYVNGEGKVVRYDAWLATLEAKAKGLAAEEVEDSMKSDLTLAASYNTNSYVNGGNVMDGTTTWQKTDTPTSAVSLTWSWLIDTNAKNSLKSSARRDAMAADLRRQRKEVESASAWSEFLRRYEEMTKRIHAGERLAKIQVERAKAEADKLSKGRSITSNVITAEQDAAEAELSLTKLLSEQRKIESQGRLFINVAQ